MKPFSRIVLPVFLLVMGAAAQAAFPGSLLVDSPGFEVGSNGAACMHGDPASSDTTPLPGPGLADLSIDYLNYLSACPTVLVRSDGMPLVLSTTMLGQRPVVRLLDPLSGEEKASLELEAGSLLGGVYAYLDDQDRMVVVDGNRHLIWVKAEQTNSDQGEAWDLIVDRSVDLSSVVTGPCGGDDCDAVVSISPGLEGAVWFVTQKALVGLYHPGGESGEGRVWWLGLGDDERIDNSFSTTVDGRAAVVTDRAFYLFSQQAEGRPWLVWRHEYDRGSARKPGQLSHGSGATPTFFGEGNQYVMITDNADQAISLIVRDGLVREPGQEQGRLICQEPIFTPGVNSGTESSAIGFGNTAIITSTYGYPYPALPEGVGPSDPESADFAGGMVRVDVKEQEGLYPETQGNGISCGCKTVWVNRVRSAAVPKLSTVLVGLTKGGRTIEDRLIYTVERKSPGGGNETTIFDTYYFTALRLATGEVVAKSLIGGGLLKDTLQMAGNVGPDRVFWQGVLSGVVRVAPLEQ